MDENQAQSLAETLGGEPWNSGGDIWLALCVNISETLSTQ